MKLLAFLAITSTVLADPDADACVSGRKKLDKNKNYIYNDGNKGYSCLEYVKAEAETLPISKIQRLGLHYDVCKDLDDAAITKLKKNLSDKQHLIQVLPPSCLARMGREDKDKSGDRLKKLWEELTTKEDVRKFLQNDPDSLCSHLNSFKVAKPMHDKIEVYCTNRSLEETIADQAARDAEKDKRIAELMALNEKHAKAKGNDAQAQLGSVATTAALLLAYFAYTILG